MAHGEMQKIRKSFEGDIGSDFPDGGQFPSG